MKNRRGLQRSTNIRSSSVSATVRTARLKTLIIVLFLASAVLAGIGGLAAFNIGGERYPPPFSIFNFAARQPPNEGPARQRLFLSKEYIYSDSRVLAVEDAGAASGSDAGIAEWKPPDDRGKESVPARVRADSSK